MPLRRLLWRASAPVFVGISRFRSQPGRTLLLLLGIAAATALLVGVFGGTLIAKDRALQQTLAELPRADQSFRIDVIGLPAETQPATSDRAARNALARLTPAAPLRVLFFRDFWLDGEFVRLAALDRYAGHVRLVSGRLPRTCRPAACEVLQIGAEGKPVLREGDITLVRVGIGELQSVAGLGPVFQRLRQARAQASVVQSIPLLAPNTAALERLPALQLLFRVRSWVAPLETAGIHAWDISRVLRRESAAHQALESAGPAFVLVGPDAALLEARSRGRAYGERMALIGGSAAALLLGFAMLAAIGLRRGLAMERRRLRQRGAVRAQVALALLTELGTITFVGWLVGIVVGGLAIAVLAEALGLPATATLTHALFERSAVIALVLAWAFAAAVVVVAVRAGGDDARTRRIRLLDVAALGAALAVAVGLTRGTLGTDAPASRGDRMLLFLLPSLVCFVAAVVAARLLGPLMALAERASRHATVAWRLALLALARAPGRTAAASAFLVVAVGFTLFAASYRSTLARGANDEASFSVPLDVTVSEGKPLKPPLAAAPLSRFEGLAPGVRAYPVLRRGADLVGVGTAEQTATILGVPSRALATIRWRSDFSREPQSTLAREVGKDASLRLRGPVLPASANALTVRTRLAGTALLVDLALRDASGRTEVVPLGKASPGSGVLSARIPPGRSGDAPRRVVGLELSLPGDEKDWFLHLAHERRDVRAPSGLLRLGPLVISSPAEAKLTDWRGWVVRGRGTTLDQGGRISYSFPEIQTIVVRPRQPTDERRLRVLASPLVAAAAGPDGAVTLDLFDTRLDVRVVGIAKRFPTVAKDEQFVIADETALSAAIDANAPGTGTPLELWLSTPGDSDKTVMRQLAHPPFSVLDRISRRNVLEKLVRDPLARAISYTLLVAGLLALVLAVIGVWATLLGELRDERGDLFDLEAQGVGPNALRSYFRLRTFALVAFSVAGGLLLGLVLSRLVVSLVRISATSGAPDPSLAFEPGWTTVGLALAAVVIGIALATEASVRTAFRGDTPERAAWSLE